MSWQINRTRERIKKLIDKVPVINTEDFSSVYMPKFLAEQTEITAKGFLSGKPLVDLKKNQAVIVDAVHIYANLINYEDYLFEEETGDESSHAQALNFLHLHYRACDQVIEHHGAQRVDFHGSRVHVVVVEPTGHEFAQERVMKALRLAQDIKQLSNLANKEIANGKYPVEFCIGLDVGVCVAINDGRNTEQEPLFLGNAANYAAKLAAGKIAGIHISDNIRNLFGFDSLGLISFEQQNVLDENAIESMISQVQPSVRIMYGKNHVSDLLNNWKTGIEKQEIGMVISSDFQFHYHKPPLATVEYKDLSPANSILMPVVSIFADIDGYTKYIDKAMTAGNVENAIRALYVIRGELNNVLRDDFKGRKVRFIGDCIHGVLAEGDELKVNNQRTIKTALHCVAAMRSSFKVCQSTLSGIGELGLAIGFEFGETPLSRVGIRGERSVRLASSVATVKAEALQSDCTGNQTAIGQCAYREASQDIKRIFKSEIIDDFDYGDIGMIMTETKPTLVSPMVSRAHTCV